MLADTVTNNMSESMYDWYVCAWRTFHCTSFWLRRRAMLPNTKEREVLSHACQTYTWTHARTSAHTQILLCTPLGGEGPLVRQGKHRAASRDRLLVPPRQHLQQHPPCRRQPQQSHGAIAPVTEHMRGQMMSPAHIHHIRFAMYSSVTDVRATTPGAWLHYRPRQTVRAYPHANAILVCVLQLHRYVAEHVHRSGRRYLAGGGESRRALFVLGSLVIAFRKETQAATDLVGEARRFGVNHFHRADAWLGCCVSLLNLLKSEAFRFEGQKARNDSDGPSSCEIQFAGFAILKSGCKDSMSVEPASPASKGTRVRASKCTRVPFISRACVRVSKSSFSCGLQRVLAASNHCQTLYTLWLSPTRSLKCVFLFYVFLVDLSVHANVCPNYTCSHLGERC